MTAGSLFFPRHTRELEGLPEATKDTVEPARPTWRISAPLHGLAANKVRETSAKCMGEQWLEPHEELDVYVEENEDEICSCGEDPKGNAETRNS